jgi:hypothetical protein
LTALLFAGKALNRLASLLLMPLGVMRYKLY